MSTSICSADLGQLLEDGQHIFCFGGGGHDLAQLGFGIFVVLQLRAQVGVFLGHILPADVFGADIFSGSLTRALICVQGIVEFFRRDAHGDVGLGDLNAVAGGRSCAGLR